MPLPCCFAAVKIWRQNLCVGQEDEVNEGRMKRLLFDTFPAVWKSVFNEFWQECYWLILPYLRFDNILIYRRKFLMTIRSRMRTIDTEETILVIEVDHSDCTVRKHFSLLLDKVHTLGLLVCGTGRYRRKPDYQSDSHNILDCCFHACCLCQLEFVCVWKYLHQSTKYIFRWISCPYKIVYFYIF
jgi:hypothetical protein